MRALVHAVKVGFDGLMYREITDIQPKVHCLQGHTYRQVRQCLSLVLEVV